MNNGVTGWVLNSAFLCCLFFSFIYPGKFSFKYLLFSKVLQFTEFSCELMDAKEVKWLPKGYTMSHWICSEKKYKNLLVFSLLLWLILKQRDFGSARPLLNPCVAALRRHQSLVFSRETWSSWSNVFHISTKTERTGALQCKEALLILRT